MAYNYIKVFSDGTQQSTSIAPVFATTSTTADYYIDNQWYDKDGVAYTTEFTYLPYKINIDASGNVLDIDNIEMPTLVEKQIDANIIKAQELKSKNACTAWVNFDGISTPPTIRDSYNVSQVIRTGTGRYDIYLENELDNTSVSITTDCNNGIDAYNRAGTSAIDSTNVIATTCFNTDTNVTVNLSVCQVQVFGGKN